ncbi:MAG: hypothetical protein KDM91_22445, partial [Verrucomicrobiae bacterium]|nr:hypothetical protein [Verrucomicrobiae bacterium]
ILTPEALSNPAALAAAATYATTTNVQINNNSESYVQIGHLGAGQSGNVVGDVNVSAGGDIIMKAGAHTRNHVTIGHTLNGFAYWDPTDNAAAQVRFFFDIDAFDNPNFRRGALFDSAIATDPSLAIFDPNGIPAGQTNLAQKRVGVTAGGPVVVEAMDGSTVKDIRGNVTVNSYGDGGVQLIGYNVPDLRDGIPDGTNDPLTGDPVLNFTDINGDGLWGRYDSNNDTVIDATDFFEPVDNDPDGDGIANFGTSTNGNNGTGNSEADGLESNYDRTFVGIGNGGASFAQWSEHAGYTFNRTDRNAELVNFRIRDMDNGQTETDRSGSNYYIGEFDTSLNRSPTFLNIYGDVEVNAHNGGVSIKAGNQVLAGAYIGNVGYELADYETSNFIVGDVTVTGATDLLIQGGGEVAFTGRANQNLRSFAMIGNGGYRTGHQFLSGDITVDFGG